MANVLFTVVISSPMNAEQNCEECTRSSQVSLQTDLSTVTVEPFPGDYSLVYPLA